MQQNLTCQPSERSHTFGKGGASLLGRYPLAVVEELIHGLPEVPEGWILSSWRTIAGNGPGEAEFEFSGAVFDTRYERGRRKGAINFNRPAKGTRLTYVFTAQQVRACYKVWERKSGLCADCTGKGCRVVGLCTEYLPDGQVVIAAKADDRTSCAACGGTGRSRTIQ